MTVSERRSQQTSQQTRVADVFQVVGGGTPATTKQSYWDGSIAWVTSADIDGEGRLTPRRRITDLAVQHSSASVVPAGSIIVATRVSLGKVGIATEPTAFSQDCQALIFDARAIDPLFALLQMRVLAANFGNVSRGTTIAGITKKQLLDLPFHVPPLSAQRHVAETIASSLTGIEAGTISLTDAQRRLSRYRSELVRRAVASVGDSRMTPLGEIADVQGGIQKQPKRAPVQNHYCFLRVANVLMGRLDLQDVHRIELFGNELERLRLQTGDLLIVEGNGSPAQIGRMAVWDGSIADCVHQNHIIRARLAPGILPEWVELVWNSPYGREAIRSVSSSTSGLYTLSGQKVRRITLSVPPLDVQQSLLAELQAAHSVLDAVDQALKVSLGHARTLRQSLLRRIVDGAPQE